MKLLDHRTWIQSCDQKKLILLVLHQMITNNIHLLVNQSAKYCSVMKLSDCNPTLSSSRHLLRAFFENTSSRRKPKQSRVGQKILVRADWKALCLKLETHQAYSLLELIAHLKSVCATQQKATRGHVKSTTDV